MSHDVVFEFKGKKQLIANCGTLRFFEAHYNCTIEALSLNVIFHDLRFPTCSIRLQGGKTIAMRCGDTFSVDGPLVIKYK